MITCKECHITFEKDRSFNAHLRRHNMKMKDYFHKHYPKKCLQTQRKLEWKSGDDLATYLSRDFVDKTALNLYFENKDNHEAKNKFLLDFIQNSYLRYSTLPSQVEFGSLPIAPNFLTFNNYFDIKALIKEKEYKTRFNYNFDYLGKLPLDNVDIKDFVINCDSREQNSYRFFSSIRGAMNAGDYALAGKAFNNTIIERKNIADFGATMVGGNERFRRELDRIRALGYYLVILVEGNIHEIHKHKFYGYSNPPFICHNMRQIIRDYSDVSQFVFGVKREMCVKYVVEFLLCGLRCKDIDLQLLIDSRHNQFHIEEFTKEDFIQLYKC